MLVAVRKVRLTKRGNGAEENQRVSVPLPKYPNLALSLFPPGLLQKPRHNFLTYYIRGYSDIVRCNVALYSLQAH